jgi:hypothetical protein
MTEEDFPVWVVRIVKPIDVMIEIPLGLIGTAVFLGRHLVARLRRVPPPDTLPVFLGLPRRRQR